MLGTRSIAVFALTAATVLPSFGQAKKAGAVARQEARQAQNQAQKQAQKQAQPPKTAVDPHPGDQVFQRFLAMKPEERQTALAKLPPQRQRQILQRIQQYQTMPGADRERVATQLERLHSLPPARQNQVRRSLQDLQNIPEDRRAKVHQELNRLSAMPDEERSARMNSEEFRNIYSPAEQQMMSNVAEVLPPRD